MLESVSNNLQLAFGLFATVCLVVFYFMLYVVINCASLWSLFFVNVLLSLRSLLTGGTNGSRMICTSQTSHVLPGFAFQFALSKAGKEQRR